MKNLAGVKEADKFIKEELYLAGIETISEKSEGEVPYTIIGRIGHWTLRRAWYYWMASTKLGRDGIPLDIALELHERKHPTDDTLHLGDVIRCDGNCTCPSPIGYGARPEYNDDLYNQLKELGLYEEITLSGRVYPNPKGSRVNRLCDEGIINATRYVTSYHVDDQVGLNELAKTLKLL